VERRAQRKRPEQGYGGPLVFRDVTFEVERGQRIVIMALNGAGKTSLLRSSRSQTEPNAGSSGLGMASHSATTAGA